MYNNILDKRKLITAKGSLSVGSIYLTKDGRLLLYLGVNKENRQLGFYLCGSVPLVQASQSFCEFKIYGENPVFLKAMVDHYLKMAIPEGILNYNSVPSLFEGFTAGINNNALAVLMSNLGVSNIYNAKYTGINPWVKSKDLIVGGVYTMGTLDDRYANLVIFVGRNKNGYNWVYLGRNYELLESSGFKILLQRVSSGYLELPESTIKNRKVQFTGKKVDIPQSWKDYITKYS